MKFYILIIVLIILYVFATWNISANEDYLYGFWVAENDEFCQNSEIDSMMLFIGEPDKGWIKSSRNCYLIIMNDICNQGLTLTYMRGWAGPGIGKYNISARAEFDTEQIWDDNVNLSIDIRNGTLIITGREDTIYAKLVKMHDTTNLAKTLEGVEIV